MTANLQNIRFTNLNFFSSVSKLENVELKIDITHNVCNLGESPTLKKTTTRIIIHPENEAVLDGGFGIKVEAEAVIELDDSATNNQVHAETARIIFPYLRSAIANLMAIAEFPPFHIPFFEILADA